MSRTSSILISIALVAICVLSRFLPHAWNMTPITAVALFASAYLGMRYSLVIIAVSMFMSDLFIGFYDARVMLSVYIGFVIAGLIGVVLRKRTSPVGIIVAAISSSTFFFLFTNWAVWQFTPMYVHSVAGLLDSYTMAIPFFKNMLFGDIAYSGALFGSYAIFTRFSNSRLNTSHQAHAAPQRS